MVKVAQRKVNKTVRQVSNGISFIDDNNSTVPQKMNIDRYIMKSSN